MKKIPCSSLWSLFLLGILLPGRATAVIYDPGMPQLAFAAQELSEALKEAGREDLQVTLIVRPNESSPEAFQIRVAGPNQVEVAGSDATGAMYGGLEVAELVRLDLPIEDQNQKPFVEKRGVKINIPLDIRTPSFDDSGEAAQRNIETMWDFEFWKEYLDDLARYRYNVVSLWAAHPFPSMIKLEKYPEIAVDDVYYAKGGSLSTTHLDPAKRLDEDTKGTLKLGKKISIDEKIQYWQQVFQYAKDRGIEIIMVHWNLHMHGADGKYGITQEQDNPATIEYIRACVRQMLLTYPQITGIAVCAGENDDRYLRDEFMTENFVFNSYGRAVMDVKELQPDREIRFIIRRHSTEYADFTNAFKDYTGGKIETSVKYAVAHMYSSRRPQEWEKRIVDEGWLDKYKVWLNLRNDDIFMHRWGSPDFAREFIRWMPQEHSPGFYMGSDTYVWGREFISKNPETAGRLEIDKHWYRFRLWGQLAYNNELGDDYWQAVLKHRFPGVDAKLLLEAWETVSEVIPQLNRSVWSPTDGSFCAEGCRRTSGFLTLDGYHLEAVAVDKNGLRTSGEINIKVGNASPSRIGDWKDKIHQVILNEGETFSNGDTRNFPRLECFLSLADDGSLALNSGAPGNSEGRIWGTNGKANRPKPHPVPFHFYIALDDGQLQIHREKPGRPKVIIYETRSVSGPGPFKLGISASRRLVIFREEGKKTEIVWRSPVQD